MEIRTDRYYTLAEGCPYASGSTSVQLRNGSGGGLGLLQDTQLIESLAHFSRERIPERVVHAKAAGAYGEFEATSDCSDITSASFLSLGKKTPVLTRISTVGRQAGSADTSRDIHGWAMKLYTDEGNQDWVFNNTPIFFLRDPAKFPSLNRAHKRHPQSHLPDTNMFWDFHVGNPEGIHELLHYFSDRGTPASLRKMNAYSSHTYKFTKEDGSFRYFKIHIKPDLGAKNLTREEATKTAGENPDFLIQDLFEAIENGEYPKWTVYAQVMEPDQAEGFRWNIFDLTKVWPHKEFPLREIGRVTLNRNPRNYFADIEQAAFSPSTMVRGIAPSADPMLQARLFAYPDAARYRLGVNYQQLPTNAAKGPVYCPFQRDGRMRFDANYDSDPSYVGSSLKPMIFYHDVKGCKPESVGAFTEHEKWAGEVCSFQSELSDDDFVQPAALWNTIGREPGHQERTIGNLAHHVRGVKYPELRSGVYALFSRVNANLGQRLKEVTEALVFEKNGDNSRVHPQ
ncbi:Catalase [Aspergillus sp. HF37]|nr:Catalase [Aspergillus sp. HF37]